MRKVIAGINMTLDGYCDHTAVNADEEIHDHYTKLLQSADTTLYGRITYKLMEDFWPGLAKEPSGERSMDEFAVAMEQIKKLVFSDTMKTVKWDSARLATEPLEEEITELKKQPGKDILIGSRSLIVQALNLELVDEFQLCVHPVIAGTGLPLLNQISDRIELKLLSTKTFGGGAVLFYYQPIKK